MRRCVGQRGAWWFLHACLVGAYWSVGLENPAHGSGHCGEDARTGGHRGHHGGNQVGGGRPLAAVAALVEPVAADDPGRLAMADPRRIKPVLHRSSGR